SNHLATFVPSENRRFDWLNSPRRTGLPLPRLRMINREGEGASRRRPVFKLGGRGNPASIRRKFAGAFRNHAFLPTLHVIVGGRIGRRWHTRRRSWIWRRLSSNVTTLRRCYVSRPRRTGRGFRGGAASARPGQCSGRDGHSQGSDFVS